MSFVSLEFIIFVVVSLIFYYVLPIKIRWLVLLIMSYAFYLIGGGKTVIYLIFTTLTTYLAAREIDFLNQKNKEVKKEQQEKMLQKIKLQKRLMVAFAVISNFSLLFFFKYWNYTVTTINGLLDSERLLVFELILPLRDFVLYFSINRVCN